MKNELENVIINDCNLSNSEIFKTSLKDIDLSTCNVENLSSDINSIKGTTVSISGMIDLARILGIKIKF